MTSCNALHPARLSKRKFTVSCCWSGHTNGSGPEQSSRLRGQRSFLGDVVWRGGIKERGVPARQPLSLCQCLGVGAAAAEGPQLRLPQGPRRLCPFWAVSLAGVALVSWGPGPIEWPFASVLQARSRSSSALATDRCRTPKPKLPPACWHSSLLPCPGN